MLTHPLLPVAASTSWSLSHFRGGDSRSDDGGSSGISGIPIVVSSVDLSQDLLTALRQFAVDGRLVEGVRRVEVRV